MNGQILAYLKNPVILPILQVTKTGFASEKTRLITLNPFGREY
jgi:hypothetical protein